MIETDGPMQGNYRGIVSEWFYATLIVPCATCEAAPGQACSETYALPRAGGTRIRIRPRFHLARYERARELAGYPIQRSEPRRPTRAEKAAAAAAEAERVRQEELEHRRAAAVADARLRQEAQERYDRRVETTQERVDELRFKAKRVTQSYLAAPLIIEHSISGERQQGRIEKRLNKMARNGNMVAGGYLTALDEARKAKALR